MTEVFPTEIHQGLSMVDTYILMLAAPEKEVCIPMLIGEHEAQSIVMAQQEIEARRPMTHTLMNNIFTEFGLALTQVTIDRFEEGIFHSTLYLTDGLTEKRIDSRTSDAVTLALLQGCKIYCHDSVLAETGVAPDSLTTGTHTSEATAATLKELESQLLECEENEEYEKAAELLERIQQIKNDTQD